MAVGILAGEPAHAQDFNVIFNLSLQNGWGPVAGVTRDAAGSLFGTTTYGGSLNGGTVYELKDSRGHWTFNNLFTFNASTGTTGYYPWSGVVLGPNNELYGTTTQGGSGQAGVVYKLTPPPTACMAVLCPWGQTVLYAFHGSPDGAAPALGNVIFDSAGNLYGTTAEGGAFGYGTVFELTPSNGSWTEKVLYSFMGGTDGYGPNGTLVFDSAGNLYGTTAEGGNTGCADNYGCGTAFELSPSGSGWTERILVAFEPGTNGCNPYGGLIFDQSGNLYGTTSDCGLCGSDYGCGTVFELSPNGDNWSFSLLYSFGPGYGGPMGSLAIDVVGSLYGTTQGDGGYQQGNVFKLTQLNGAWTYTDLHDFTGGYDGAQPYGTPILDAMGVVYGTTEAGGTQSCGFEEQCGVVWAITPQ